MKVSAERGDITRVVADAIVNAANESLLGGGGVDGAIHRAAGPALLEACAALPEVRPGVRCPTGEARITRGFALPAPWVIHAVGPRHRGTSDDAELLAAAYAACLHLAAAHGLRSIAFPAISCGVYGYPVADAAKIAVHVVSGVSSSLEHVRFVLFSEENLRVFQEAIDRARRAQELSGSSD